MSGQLLLLIVQVSNFELLRAPMSRKVRVKVSSGSGALVALANCV